MQARPGDAEQQQPVAGLSDEVHLLGGERTQQHLEQGWGDLGERAVQAERLVCLQRRDPAVLGDERQQLLSLIAQHGGITPLQAHETLCLHGPFAQVSPTLFKMLLRALAAEKMDLITQASDGLLLLGVAGARLHTWTRRPSGCSPKGAPTSGGSASATTPCSHQVWTRSSLPGAGTASCPRSQSP